MDFLGVLLQLLLLLPFIQINMEFKHEHGKLRIKLMLRFNSFKK